MNKNQSNFVMVMVDGSLERAVISNQEFNFVQKLIKENDIVTRLDQTGYFS